MSAGKGAGGGQGMMGMDGVKYWDGTESMPFVRDDGGREAAGFRGSARDCVARSVAIASGKPYAEVYAALAAGAGGERKSTGRSARNGIRTGRKWFKDYMRAIGFVWTPTMRIGSGCTTRLLKGELPMGRLVVAVSRHYTAVIDGVIHDTGDPTRTTLHYEAGHERMSHRCVYGYWQLAALSEPQS